MSIKKHLPTITILTIIIGIIALGIWYSDLPRGKAGKDSPIKELAKLDVYSKEELSFLEKEGFLDNIDSENLPDNKEQIVSLLKSPNLIEQNLNSPDESFEVLATKLGENTYQLAFKLENKSNQSKEFYLIPISESSQTEFKEIRGRISGSITEVHNTPLVELYDVGEHKSELKPELAQAYDDIDNNGYTGKPIKVVLEPNSVLIAQSKWEIRRGPTSDSLEPVYLLVYGSAAGVVDELYKDTSFEQLNNITKETGIYRITYDEYSDVEIKDQDTPEVKLRKWGDETYIKVSYPDFTPVNPKQNNGKMKWINGNKEVHLYPIEKTEDLPEGFEFEIILLEKPTTNKIVLNMETKGLKFYYQPELTQKEIDEGAFRPENVIGSYAVYHATKGNMHAGQEEAEKYKTSKAFHIYRPKITDAEGNWVWESQVIDVEKGKITITIPQDFIDNAVYPIRSTGETFGYEEEGGTPHNLTKNFQWATGPYLGSAGTGTSMSFYGLTGPPTKNVTMGIWNDNSGVPGTLVDDTQEVTVDTTGTWWSASFNGSPSFSVANYHLGWSFEDDSVLIYFDSDSFTEDLWYDSYPYVAGTLEDFNPTEWRTNRRYSLYVTYDAPDTPPPSVGIKGGLRVKGGLKIKF